MEDINSLRNHDKTKLWRLFRVLMMVAVVGTLTYKNLTLSQTCAAHTWIFVVATIANACAVIGTVIFSTLDMSERRFALATVDILCACSLIFTFNFLLEVTSITQKILGPYLH